MAKVMIVKSDNIAIAGAGRSDDQTFLDDIVNKKIRDIEMRGGVQQIAMVPTGEPGTVAIMIVYEE